MDETDADVEFETYSEEFSARSFYEHYKDQLPKMVMVTQGYMGEVGFETFDKGQVFRIQTYSTQKRVVASIVHVTGGLHGLQGRHISIPADYDAKFKVLTHWKPKGGKPHSLREIIEQKHLPVEVHFAEDDTHSMVNIGGIERTSSRFTLKLLHAFDDFYLLGNAICYGHLYGTVTAIPVYLPDVRFAVVKSIKGYTDEQYKNFLDVTDQNVQEHIKFDQTFGNTDIALYSHEHAQGAHENYSYVSPTEYCDIDEILMNRKVKPSKQRKKDKGVAYEVYRVSTASVEGYDTTNSQTKDILSTHDSSIERDNSVKTGDYEEIGLRKSHNNTKDHSGNTRKPKPPLPTPKPELQPTSMESKELNTPPLLPSRVSTVNNSPNISGTSVSSIRKKYESSNVGRALPQVKSDVTLNTQQSMTSSIQPDYGTLSSLTVDVESLTMEDVSEWLHILKLGKYADIFLENQVDGCLLKELDKQILKDDFGMKDFEILKLSKFAKSGYVPRSRTRSDQ